MSEPTAPSARGEAKRSKRPLVVMLLNSEPWSEDWAAAADQVADVVRLLPRKSTVRWARRVLTPIGPMTYEIALPHRVIPARISERGAMTLLGHQYVRALREIQDRHGRIAVVHAHTYPQAIPLPFAARRGFPFIVTEHLTAWTGENPERKMTPAGLERARRVYSAASLVIPVSEGLRRAIERRGVTGRFQVIPNPVDCAMFAPVARPAEAAGPPVIVNVGRHAPEKGLDVLLRAASLLRQGHKEFSLVLVGDGPAHMELCRLASALQLEDVVTFRGRLTKPAIAAELSRGDVFAMSSWAENLPVAVIEAVSAGLPVVGTDVGSVRELVEGQTYVLVPPGEPAALANALTQVMDHLPTNDDRRRMSEAARTRFDKATIGHQLGEIYDRF